jgi:signal transduction histidine kinase
LGVGVPSGRIAGEQAALRRVAVLAASGAPPDEVFAAITAEIARLLDVDVASVDRYDSGEVMTTVARWRGAGEGADKDRRGHPRTRLGGRNAATLVFETGRPARIDDFSTASGPVADDARELGARSSVGVPISVEGRLWGVMRVISTREEPLPAEAEARLTRFTELASSAIANAQARVELREYADEQAALRRMATLIASGAPPEEVFATVAAEAGRLLGADFTGVGRYDPGGILALAGTWRSNGAVIPQVTGIRMSLGGRNVATLVFQTGRPARLDDYSEASGPVADYVHEFGLTNSTVGAPISVEGRLWGVMLVSSGGEEPLPADSEARLAHFTDLVGTAIASAQARVELRGYADEQAALRRVATLVAAGAPPPEVFGAVAKEIAGVLATDFASMSRYEADGTATVIGAWTRADISLTMAVGDRLSLGGLNVTTLVHETGQPARIENYGDASGMFADAAREARLRTAAGVPISVGGRLWGVVTVGFARRASLPADTEARLTAFTELVGTAIANVETQTALAASRARIVTAADEARQRIERDLHDGAQQRLVTLALELREIQATAPPGAAGLIRRLDDVATGLEAALDELREIARGIHPAVLAQGGLRPALQALARHCPVPVDLRIQIPAAARLPGPAEIAAYYVVSEALTNTARHAGATAATVEVSAGEDTLRVSVRDNGHGGADLTHGSGLVGLRDRVEAIGGRLAVGNEPGAGTSLEVHLPLGR